MKRLLSVISVFCILWLIIQISVWDKPDSLSSTDRDILAMITYVKHGTGLWVESLYMTVQNEAGNWEMYEFLESDYCFQLREHFDTVIDGDDIGFVFDGSLIGAPELFEQGVSYRYDVGNQIEFAYTPDGIEIMAEVEGICTSGGYGSNDYPGYVISAQVKHLGNGNWLLENVCCQTEK